MYPVSLATDPHTYFEFEFIAALQRCIEFPIPPQCRGGGIIQSEYQDVKKRREYQGCGEEHNEKFKKGKRRQNLLPFNIKAARLGRISSQEEGKRGLKVRTIKSRFYKCQVARELYTPLLRCAPY